MRQKNAIHTNTKDTLATLDVVDIISKSLADKLGASVRFFIKGGAAVPLLLGKSYEAITGDVDTMLLINPSLRDFEEKRKTAIMICIEKLTKIFPPHILEYSLIYNNDTTMKNISKIYTGIKPGTISHITNPYQLLIIPSFDNGGVFKEFTQIQLKKRSDVVITTLLDIAIPKIKYPLLSYYWNTILPVEIQYKKGGSVPVIDIVSAYVNQAYATGKTINPANKEKRKSRANALLKNIKNKKLLTRKANRTTHLPANEAELFTPIVSTLPNNTPPLSINQAALQAALLQAYMNMYHKGEVAASAPASGGAGAGAGAGAAAGAAAAAPSSSPFSPPLPSSPPLPPLLPTPAYSPKDPRRNALGKGEKWIVQPLYTEEHVFLSPAEDYVLRRYTNGTIDEILDFRTDELLTRIEYVGDPARNGQMFYKVFSNGKWYTRFNPATSYFDPITMKVYPHRR